MRPGETATIAGFDDPELANKLMEMGLLPGTAIRINFFAPLGDPVSVSAGTSTISLRLSEAACIQVLR
jgi:ferrous iron transport protein A